MPGSAMLIPLPDQFDAARFLRLIDIAGPSLAPTLLDQLVEDLDTSHRLFGAALDRGDWDGLRQASHDLISLSGSAGADTLHDLARSSSARRLTIATLEGPPGVSVSYTHLTLPTSDLV